MPEIALTIAGSDSGGGAGIQADLKTFEAFGVYGASVITAITAQNTLGVTAVHEVPAEIVTAQMHAVLSDFKVGAAKTGMLSSSVIIQAVTGKLREFSLSQLVVDPVMVAKSGDTLLQQDAVQSMREYLLPLALVVTPNIPEAEVLADVVISTEADRQEAARRIYAMGPQWVVIKGGHLEGDPIDLIWNGDEMLQMRGTRIPSRSTHGTGCTFAAAITARLSEGKDVFESIQEAKEFLNQAIVHAEDLGHGNGPLNHHYKKVISSWL